MSKRILAFGASSSRKSINKQLASYAASQLTELESLVLDLNDFEMPIYSIDREREDGFPELAERFLQHLQEADGIIISFAEHNGAYSTAFKNIFDWVSRLEKNLWGGKPMLLMATSPGGRGGQTVLDIAHAKLSRMNKGPLFRFSLPSFHQNMVDGQMVDDELSQAFQQELSAFKDAVLA